MEDSDGFDVHISSTTIRRLYWLLFASAIILIVGTALSDVGFSRLPTLVAFQLDLKQEGNAAVWCSSTVLLLAAVGGLAVAGKPVSTVAANRWGRVAWTLVALFLVALSLDETAQLHERAGDSFTRYFGTVKFLTENKPTFGWLLCLLPLIALFYVCTTTAVRCWGALRPRGRMLVLGAVACWSGVLVAEFGEAQLIRWSMERSLQGAAEEGLEFIGASLFVAAFVEYLRADAREKRRTSVAATRVTVQDC